MTNKPSVLGCFFCQNFRLFFADEEVSLLVLFVFLAKKGLL